MNYLIFINVLIFDWDNILTGNVFMAMPLAALRRNFHSYTFASPLAAGVALCTIYSSCLQFAFLGFQHDVSSQSIFKKKKNTTQYGLESCSEPNNLAN